VDRDVIVRLSMLAAGALLAGAANAAPCRLVVALEGEPAAVAAIRDQLSSRGISTDTSTCPGMRTRVERRGELFVIGFTDADGVPIERVVSDPGTAATVIESFVRVDVGTPLLASRAIPAVTVRRDPEPVAPTVAARARTGAHVFGSFDSAFASDRTSWLGMQVVACIMLGPTCPSARFRFDVVVTGDGTWDDSTFRNSSELLVGIDVPLAAGGWLVMPGVAVGMGGVRTEESSVKRETTGFRGELHGTLLVPLTATLAVDLSVAGVLLQEMKVDEGLMAPLPPDPWVVFRFGVGLRYGRR
jgi:hypothetical protein